MVGAFESPADGRERGFVYDPATTGYTVIEVPGALKTIPTALDNQGRLLGYTYDVHGNLRSFLWVQGVFTFPEIPERPGAAARRVHGQWAPGRQLGQQGVCL